MEWIFAIGFTVVAFSLLAMKDTLAKILAVLERIERADRDHHTIMNHLGSDATRCLQHIADRSFMPD